MLGIQCRTQRTPIPQFSFFAASPSSSDPAPHPAPAAAGKRRRNPSPDPASAAPADPAVLADPAASADPSGASPASPAPGAPAAAALVPLAAALAPAAPVAAPVALAPRVTELDLAISFDVTGSMGPCIFQVRRELERLSKELFEDLAGMGVSVRVAVITQADYDASPYVTRHMDFSGDGAAVSAFITGVQASSGGWNEGEAYEQALLLANSLAWRASATKAFILIGDDLPHPPTWPANEKRVDWQAEAQSLAARDVALYAVRGVAAAASAGRTAQCVLLHRSVPFHPAGRALLQVQCPCLDIQRARHFYEALALAHPRGAYALLTQVIILRSILHDKTVAQLHAPHPSPEVLRHHRPPPRPRLPRDGRPPRARGPRAQPPRPRALQPRPRGCLQRAAGPRGRAPRCNRPGGAGSVRRRRGWRRQWRGASRWRPPSAR